jgi:hypothetical protein
VREPQCSNCGACPKAVKGSKISEDGTEGYACQEYRLLAVKPAAALHMPAMRMKLRVTSDFDGRSPELQKEGWFAFKNYQDFLRSKRIVHTATLITKMKFDAKNFPKVLFGADRLLSKEEFDKVRPIIKDEATQKLIGDAWSPNGVDGVSTHLAETVGNTDTPKQTAPKQTAPKQTAPKTDKAKAAPKNVEPKQAAPEPEPFITDEMDGGAAGSSDVPSDVADLLDDWGSV